MIYYIYLSIGIIIGVLIGLVLGSILAVFCVTKGIVIDMLKQKDFDRIKKAVEKRNNS